MTSERPLVRAAKARRRALFFSAVSALLALGATAGAPAPADVVDLVVSPSGFRPRSVKATKGDPLRLRITTPSGEHCFALDELRLEKRVVAGRTTTVDLTPGRAGTFPFYCCVESGEAAERERGELVVSE